MANSGVFPIFLRAEYRNDGKAFQGFQSDAARAAQAAKREFQGVGAALDAALSRGRTSGGALDLGVEELKRAAQEQQRLAAAAREVAEASRRAATANGTFDASLSRSTKAAFEFANAQDRASREMIEQIALLDRIQGELNQTASATNAATAAGRRSAAVSGQQRQGLQQLSFQLNDVATMFALGARPQQIFASQAGQVIQAVQMMTGGTSRLAGFLGGPWGLALTSAAIVVTPFIGRLFEAGEAAELAKTGADNLTAAQSVLGGVFDEVSGKLKTQNELLILNARLTALNLRSEALAKRSSSDAIFASAGARSASDRIFGGGVSDSAAARAGIAPRQSRGQNNAAIVRGLLEGVKAGRISADEALKRSANLDFTGVGATREEFQQAIIDRASSRDAERVAALIEQSLDSGALDPELRRDRKTRTRSGRSSADKAASGQSSADKAAKEAARLADFGERAAESIARINERFDASPRLIDQAAQATRQLDEIIADLAERKPVNFEQMIADAQAAKSTIEEALLRPIEEIREQSEQRLQIEQALSQGRTDEAQALQEIFRLRQTTGKVTAEQADEVREIVRLEQERIRYLQDQQRLFLAQLDVVEQVQRSLTDLLSGRSTNFFGDFKQALRDLQGQRLFEDIFGETFRSIREELQFNTPLGRANKALADETTKTTSTVTRLETSLDGLGDAVDRARDKLLSDFDREFGAANDNVGLGAASLGRRANDLLFVAGFGTISVNGNRGGNGISQVEIARRSITDLAGRISSSIGSSIAAQLEDVLGPRFASMLGDVIGGYIGGKALAGTTGGILGGLQNLTKGIPGLGGISDAFGIAGSGAIVGTNVAGISKLLGIRGSTTGAQIGGALGSFIPIPGGQIIGAIAGNLLGGLLKGTPRGSATIGGIGGSLGVTGISGNRGSLKDAAGNLAGSVLEAIDRIAEQLGAQVNSSAGRVSIGQRKDNLRVDPTGRGITKIGNGAIDFGQDAEAAIAFAVRDLIQDGVITGLKASEQRLLTAGNDIEASLRDVLDFRSVFDRLKEIRDPIGAAVDAVTREFDRYRDLFRRANADAAELATLEELAGIERARAIQEATDRVAGSLKGLLDSLQLGDSGLSLRTRQGNAQSRFDALAARVAAGDASAFDDFADISQQLLDIERQLFGSTQAYFDRLQQVTALTEKAIAGQTNVASISPSAPAIANEAASINRALSSQTDALASRLDAIIANQVAAVGVRSIGAERGFDTPSPALVANF